jgi:hypothetical protein
VGHAEAPKRAAVPREEERAELPALIAHYRHELTVTPAEDKTRREMLDWQIRWAQKRLAEVEARLAKVSAESGP